MACASCAQKQQYAGMIYTRFIEEPVQSDECHFTLEELQSKKGSLLNQKISATPTQLTRITYDLSVVNRAIKNYDTNCNKYLKDLYAVFSR